MTALVVRVQNLIASLRDREEGQTMAEYAVVLGVISASVIVAFTALSGGVRNAIDNAATIIKSLG